MISLSALREPDREWASIFFYSDARLVVTGYTRNRELWEHDELGILLAGSSCDMGLDTTPPQNLGFRISVFGSFR